MMLRELQERRFQTYPTDEGTFVVWDNQRKEVVAWDGKPIEFTGQGNADRMAHVLEVRS